MSSFTNFLNLFKWNAIEDSEEEFNIDKALNENWDKIDTKLETYTTDLTNEVNQFTEDTNATINNYKTSTDKRVDELETQISSIKEISISATEPTADEVLWVKRGEGIDTTLNIKENGSFSEILNIDQILKEVIPKNAGAHNAIYRGKDITDLFYNGTLSKQISAGTFDDIFIGDYIIGKTSGRKYLVADINYRLHCGNTECTKPHVLMIPEKTMGNEQMNSSNVTTGAYIGSAMYTTHLAKYKTVINNDFGSGHILKHRNHLQNAVTNGYESDGTWYDSTIDLMNEIMVYGCMVFKNAQSGTNIPSNYQIDKSQLSLFRHRHDLTVAFNDSNARQAYWLRDVVSSASFAFAGGYSDASYTSASNSYGVRPAFLIY